MLAYTPALRGLVVHGWDAGSLAQMPSGVESLHIRAELAHVDDLFARWQGLNTLDVVVRTQTDASALLSLPRARQRLVVRVAPPLSYAVVAAMLLLAFQPRNSPDPLPAILKLVAYVPGGVDSAPPIEPLRELCAVRGIWLKFIALLPP